MAWWAVYCEAGRERLAADSLLALGLDVFFPHEKIKRRVCLRRSSIYKIRESELAVFPRYLFVEGGEVVGAGLLRRARGVLALVSGPDGPLCVSERVVARLRALGDDDGLMSSRDVSTLRAELGFYEGQRVWLADCVVAFAGHAAVIRSLDRLEAAQQVCVDATLFGRPTPVWVDYRDITSLSPGLVRGSSDTVLAVTATA